VRTRVALLVGLLAVAVVGCGDGDSDGAPSAVSDARATTFTGRTTDGGTLVGLVVDGEGDALAYATDGDRSVDWVFGAVDDGTGSLDNDGGAVLDATVTDDRASGTFTRPGFEPLRFTARAASSPAGLYRAQESFADGDYVAGWIVLADGTQRGAIRRYETPLPPDAIDASTFRPGDDGFTVPGGQLTVERYGRNADV
jgi:hypothetical protein